MQIIQFNIFYYREIPGEVNIVLVNSRCNMTFPLKNSNGLVFVDLSNKHKKMIQLLPEEYDCHTLFEDTDFTQPIFNDFE
jgi:hypothetical protein